jgi:bla regulator protein BlaR1
MWNVMLVGHGARCVIPVVLDAELGPALLWLPRGYLLVLPADHWPALSWGEQQAVLLHELAHWLRGGLWKSLAVRIAALPHWFNPLTWLAVRRFEAFQHYGLSPASGQRSLVL